MPARHVLTILAVDDLPRAVAFYRAALSLAHTVDAPVYAELSDDAGMRLGLYRRDGFAKNVGGVTPPAVAPGALSSTELYFHVDDLGAAVAALERAGARLLSARAMRDWGDEAAYFADPDGNVIAVATAAQS